MSGSVMRLLSHGDMWGVERRERLRTYKRPRWTLWLRVRARIVTAQQDSIRDTANTGM